MVKQFIYSLLLLLPTVIMGQDITIEPVKLLHGNPHYLAPVVIDSVLYFSSDKKTDLLVTNLDQDDRTFYKLYKVNLKNRLPNGNAVQLFAEVTPFHQIAVTQYPLDGGMLVTQNLNLQRVGWLAGSKANPLTFVHAAKGLRSLARARTLPLSLPRSTNMAYPAVSADGSLLLFVSDMADGFGGSDIYYSQLTDEGWSKPVNAGNIINTAGNESFPFISASGKIFFSSTGHEGSGRYHLYQTTFNAGIFTRPEMLDAPYNSDGDDYSIFFGADEQWGYLCSSRDGGDNIYFFENQFPELPDAEPYEETQLCYTFYESSAENYDPEEFGFKWTFSDGTSARGIETDHCFDGLGKYSVSLEVYDKVTGENLFTVSEFEMDITPKPQVNILHSDVVKAGEETTFEADISLIGNFQTTGFYWQLNNGIKKKGKKINHIFTTPGTYRITCGVIDRNDPSRKICTSMEILVTQ